MVKPITHTDGAVAGHNPVSPTWAFDPANAAAIAGWGFWLAVAALVLTVAGFAITLYQISRTRSAADAAKDEVERIQRSLNRYDIVNDASRATTALATARDFLRHGLWQNVADSYETVRDCMEALRSDASGLSDDHRARIANAGDYIQNLCVRIERDRQKGKVTIDVAKTTSVMSEHRMLLSELSRIIEKGVIE